MTQSAEDTLVLNEFKAQLDKMAKDGVVAAFSPLIEPYIITHNQAGQSFKLIIFNEQSKGWYDNTREESTFTQYEKFNLIKPGDVVFDLGCHIGFNALWMAMKAGPQGKVYAFDIFAWHTLAMEYNAKLNGLQNIYPITLGVGGSSYMRDIVAAEARIHQTVSLKMRPKTTIHVVPLDCFAGLKPNFIKCDIEGAEYEMLAGAQQTFAQHPILMLELHATFIRQLGLDPLDVLRELNGCGYDVHLNAPDGDLFSDKVATIENMGTYAFPRATANTKFGQKPVHYVDAKRRKLDLVALITKSIKARWKKAA